MMSRIVVCALALAAATLSMAEEKASPASGNWKLNLEKSDFGPFPAPESIVQKVEDRAEDIKVEQVSMVNGEEQRFSFVSVKGGKENVHSLNGMEFHSKIWDEEAGGTREETLLTLPDGTKVDIKAKTTFSEDGKTKTQKLDFSSAMGEASQTLVYDKQ
jgi:hypothetical protein